MKHENNNYIKTQHSFYFGFNKRHPHPPTHSRAQWLIVIERWVRQAILFNWNIILPQIIIFLFDFLFFYRTQKAPSLEVIFFVQSRVLIVFPSSILFPPFTQIYHFPRMWTYFFILVRANAILFMSNFGAVCFFLAAKKHLWRSKTSNRHYTRNVDDKKKETTPSIQQSFIIMLFWKLRQWRSF